DHPNPPPTGVIPARDPKAPSVVMTRRDWEVLWDQLRSATAIVDRLPRGRGRRRSPRQPPGRVAVALARGELTGRAALDELGHPTVAGGGLFGRRHPDGAELAVRRGRLLPEGGGSGGVSELRCVRI